jgi:uncharacterized membrane protein SirB2
MYTGMLHTHTLVVTLFLLQYLIKTILLLANKTESLQSYTKKTKVAEMIVSVLFLATGIYLAMQSGNTGQWLWVKLGAVFISIPLAVVGFKKQNKMLALLALLLIVYAYGVSETKSPVFKKAAMGENNFSAVPDEQLGKTIYEAKCMNCHGGDGKMGLSGAKDLTASTLSRDEKKAIITNGKNAMMPFKDQLTTEQIDAVTSYVESLK